MDAWAIATLVLGLCPRLIPAAVANRNIDLRDYVDEAARNDDDSYCYDLLCNIVHEGQPGAGKGTYRTHVYHKVRRNTVELAQ
jgi:hypothetical protein